ncbi:MAG TPA: Cys-tRNA(Pro) deacylase [Bacillota bacterium]|nr:Cys-tRNA(Pro) deacylase [Bacillota bacterium]
MSDQKLPVTPAIRVLRAANISFTDHPYAYEERGGTAVSARELGVDEHSVVKTLIMEDEGKNPLIVLMHGDLEVSTKDLARFLKVKTIAPCAPDIASKHSGYLVGGTSPFGTRKAMPVYLEESIMDMPKIYINGGKRGYLVGIDPKELVKLLNPVFVRVGIQS